MLPFMSIAENLDNLKKDLPEGVRIVVVSKTKPVADILQAYSTGHRIFGENKAQELETKVPLLPGDIEWHFIGHLQGNKVRIIAPLVSVIHSIDSLKLLAEVNREAARCNKTIRCLLQFHIAKEETKFGLDLDEGVKILLSDEFKKMQHVKIAGVMGMATFTEDESLVRGEFRELRELFQYLRKQYFGSDPGFAEISMGMSGDYRIAIEEGSTLVRLGTAVFGAL
jgi:pyridoxal phosphate enzyme (YggS family)